MDTLKQILAVMFLSVIGVIGGLYLGIVAVEIGAMGIFIFSLIGYFYELKKRYPGNKPKQEAVIDAAEPSTDAQ